MTSPAPPRGRSCQLLCFLSLCLNFSGTVTTSPPPSHNCLFLSLPGHCGRVAPRSWRLVVLWLDSWSSSDSNNNLFSDGHSEHGGLSGLLPPSLPCKRHHFHTGFMAGLNDYVFLWLLCQCKVLCLQPGSPSFWEPGLALQTASLFSQCCLSMSAWFLAFLLDPTSFSFLHQRGYVLLFASTPPSLFLVGQFVPGSLDGFCNL